MKNKGCLNKIDGVPEELTDLSKIIQGYKTDMTSIMKPIKRGSLMQVDRNDIYWNKQSIISACSSVSTFPLRVSVVEIKDGFSLDDSREEKARKRRNDEKLDEIKKTLSTSAAKFEKLMDQMNGLYKKVKLYENMNDTYAKKANKKKRNTQVSGKGQEMSFML